MTVSGLPLAGQSHVPSLVHDPGDPVHEGVPAARVGWRARPTPIEAPSPVRVGGGMAELDDKGTAGGVRVAPLRRPAP